MRLSVIIAALLTLAVVPVLVSAAQGPRAPIVPPAAPAQNAGPPAREQGAFPPGDELTISPHTEELIARQFATCDHDGNGWISFRESRESLHFDRGKYQYHDSDRDGRLWPAEYRAYFLDTLGRSGSVAPPIPAAGAMRPPERTPEQLRSAYDLTSDGRLDLQEITQLLLDYQRTDMSPDQALVALDRNSSGHLEIDEIPGLLGILGPQGTGIAGETGAAEGPVPTTVLELFGGAQARVLGPGSAPHPDQIIGPVPPFYRLDVDRDGRISAMDLERLQRPLQLPVRLRAVLATLDLDGDGTLSRDEFRRALGVPIGD
jgi:Ca2+-binding EF-hand superfamily protein